MSAVFPQLVFDDDADVHFLAEAAVYQVDFGLCRRKLLLFPAEQALFVLYGFFIPLSHRFIGIGKKKDDKHGKEVP